MPNRIWTLIKVLCLWAALFTASILQAQLFPSDTLSLSATILDSSTSEPIPYSSIYIKERGRGTISDINGHFSFSKISHQDTITISFIGYAERKMVISSSIENGIFYLSPKPELLHEVTVYSSNEYLYQLVSKVVKTQNHELDTAKTYYSLQSTINNKLVELVECYYNGYYKGYDVNKLDLKNGRLALKDFNRRYYISTETSRVMYLHKLFDNSDFLPKNPLVYNKRKLKRLYDLKLVSKYSEHDSSIIYVIDYSPLKKEKKGFSGTLWIDSATSNLQKITLEIKGAATHPFIPHGYTDSLIQVDLKIARTYEPLLAKPRVKSIDFDYQLTYKTKDGQRVISNTQAVLYAYNYHEKFKLPYFHFTDASYEDYRKISASPYNDFFWEHRDEFAMERGKEEKEYFLNHQSQYTSRDLFSSKSFMGKSFFEHPYVFWSTDRVAFAEENYDPIRFSKVPPAYRYNLKAQIYLDINQSSDSVNFITKTIFDPFESYYYFKPTTEGQAFINMYFDLVEIYRRRLDESLKESENLLSESDSIYKDNQEQLEIVSAQFLKDVDHGTNRAEMQKWSGFINSALKIDNLQIFKIDQ